MSSTAKLPFLVATLAAGLLAGCVSSSDTQPQVAEDSSASEYRYVTGSYIRRQVPVDTRYLNTTHRVRIIDEAEMRETGSTNLAEILHRSGVF